VTVTATPQVDDGLKSIQPSLAASLAARFDQGGPERGPFVENLSDTRLGSSLDLQSLEVALERLGEIAHQVISVRDLLRRWSALSRAVSIQTTAIPADDLDGGLTT
jgi:hypothetical protein